MGNCPSNVGLSETIKNSQICCGAEGSTLQILHPFKMQLLYINGIQNLPSGKHTKNYG